MPDERMRVHEHLARLLEQTGDPVIHVEGDIETRKGQIDTHLFS